MSSDPPGPRGTDEPPTKPPLDKGDRIRFGRRYQSRLSQSQQYIFIGLALLFLVGWVLFRGSCSRRLGEAFGTVSPARAPDAGADAAPARPTRRPPRDPDDW